MAMMSSLSAAAAARSPPFPPLNRRGTSGKAIAAALPSSRSRRSENVEGEFFVDKRCIDCDTCRWMAPEVFSRIGEQSAVFKQPRTEEERLRTLQALVCCPTGSIHSEKPPTEILEVQNSFPLPVDEHKLPGVFHCGYHSEKSYGATAYLIIHPEGNILIDSPKYIEKLAAKIEGLGGARYMFLTHKDDVGDHEKWAKRLDCERILHTDDVEPGTANVEMQLTGSGPWNIGRDFEVIHTPGHTKGSACLLYKPLQVLFTGDHLIGSGAFDLSIMEQYNKDSVLAQLDSARKFLDLPFLWILPGHGWRVQFKDGYEKNSRLFDFLEFKEQELGIGATLN